jgi:para-nitrobenzyl esterase
MEIRKLTIAKSLSLVAGLSMVAGSLVSSAEVAEAAPGAFARALALPGARYAARPRTAAGNPIVVAPAGALEGITTQNMDSYRGIPYAEPPLGVLRWEPPEAPARWTGIRRATKFADHCPQLATAAGVASTTENCLYLNVFTPAGTPAKAGLPVMVWIHGGGFQTGESDDYNPDKLVAPGRVVVTLNYRLGSLGFLATTGLDAESHLHVNYGIMDQQAALRWVQSNISAFGGNPANTTLFGQSAGGASVMTQLIWPASAGLFQHAIIQSGSYALITTPPLATAETNGNAFAAYEGCAPTDTACLRALPVQKILAAPGAGGAAAFAGGLAVDGTILPESPLDAFAEQQYAKVPILQNTDHDEFRLFAAELFDLSGGPLTAAEYPVFTKATLSAVGLGNYTQLVLDEYPLSSYASPDLAVSAWVTDAAFATPALVMDDLFSPGDPAALYTSEFADENEPNWELPPISFPIAACHQSELPFIYDSYNPKFHLTLSPAEQQLQETMVDYWTQFAATGSPNNSDTPYWTPFIAGLGNMNEFVPPGASLSASFQTFHNTTFWTAIFGLLAAQDTAPGLSGGLALPAHQHVAMPRLLDAVFSAARERHVRRS